MNYYEVSLESSPYTSSKVASIEANSACEAVELAFSYGYLTIYGNHPALCFVKTRAGIMFKFEVANAE